MNWRSPRVGSWLVFLFCLVFPLGTRHLVHQFGEPVLPYAAVFLYATDLVAAALVGWLIATDAKQRGPASVGTAALTLFFMLGLVSALASQAVLSSLLVWARAGLYALLAILGARRIASDRRLRWERAVLAMWIGGVTQSLLAVAQFLRQHDLGLWFLGEQMLAPNLAGVAKMNAGGVIYIRAYGTLPHPNVLGAFLIFTVLTSAAAYVAKRDSGSCGSAFWPSAAWLAGIALMFVSLFFTFSRSSWLGLLFGMLLFAGLLCRGTLAGSVQKQKAWALAVLLALSGLAVAIFMPTTFAWRTHVDITDATVQDRLHGVYWTSLMVSDHRFFGVGPGQFTQRIKSYVGALPELWMYQPVHAAYLLIAAEWGLLALLVFLFVAAWLLVCACRSWLADRTMFAVCGISVFSAFLLLGLFDHYFFTFEQGMVLFWAAVGLMLAQGSKITGNR